MLDVLAGSPAPDRLVDLSAHKVRGSERTASYEEARKVVEQSALDELAVRDRDLLQALLEGFARAYDAAKRREGVLDFEDLQLNARDLLRSNERIREREHLRFAAIMVDEFQDTNRLQCELIDLVADGPAKPGALLRRRRVPVDLRIPARGRAGLPRAARSPRAAGSRSSATTARVPKCSRRSTTCSRTSSATASSRSLRPASSRTPSSAIPVELLVTEKETYADTGVHWRRAEAKHIARRVRELVDEGAATPGEIVLLFAAGTDADAYEEELRQAGLPTYRATGRGYFGQQQVVDLLSYMLLLQNRYDDQALVAVLASPFVGVSNDALVLIRRAASKRPLFTGIEKGLPPELDERDAQLIRAFLQRYERLVRALPRLPLERLCEQIVSEHDYDLAVLAQWDGRRRYANLRKLARLARSYEELRGPNLEGFVRFVRDQEAVGAKELEAVAEEEGSDSVRLLTIHAAKGLEFKVVVVADAGRDKRAPDADEILALADGRFGFKVADPATSKRRGAFDYEEVPQGAGGGGPRGAAPPLLRRDDARRRPADRLRCDRPREHRRPLDADGLGAAATRRRRGARRRRRRAARARPRGRARAGSLRPVPRRARGGRGRQASRASSSCSARARSSRCRRRRRRCRSFTRSPSPRSITCAGSRSPRSRCSRRARTATSPSASQACARSTSQPVGHEGLSGTAIGSAVHAELEHVDLAAPALAPGWEERVRAAYPRATDEEVERIRSLIEAYCTSELAARVSALDGVAKERHFTFEHDGVLLHGFLDTYHRAGERALVVDYKSNLLEAQEPAEIVARSYELQRLVYALACFRAGAERGRGRVPVPRAAGRARGHDVHARAGARARGRALCGDRAPARRASSGRRRASTRVPAARRSTSSAPGRGCRTSRSRATPPRRSRSAQLRRGGAPPRPRPEARAGQARSSTDSRASTRTRRSRSRFAPRSSCSSR